MLGRLEIIFEVLSKAKVQAEVQPQRPLRLYDPSGPYDPSKKTFTFTEEAVKEYSRKLAQSELFNSVETFKDLQQVIHMYTAVVGMQLKILIEGLYKQGFDVSSVFSKKQAIKIYNTSNEKFDYLWKGDFLSAKDKDGSQVKPIDSLVNLKKEILKQIVDLNSKILEIGNAKRIKKEKRYAASLLLAYNSVLLAAIEKAETLKI